MITTAEVAALQGITISELLWWHLGGEDPGDLAWEYVEEVSLDKDRLGDHLDEFELLGYLDEEDIGVYDDLMEDGQLPPPAYILCSGRYHKGDGGHRTAIAWSMWGSIDAWVARCTVHEQPGAELP